jgi:hypothetical protein
MHLTEQARPAIDTSVATERCDWRAQRETEVNALNAAVMAAFAEIQCQSPQAIDCSEKQDFTVVLVFDGMDLRLVILAALAAACAPTV